MGDKPFSWSYSQLTGFETCPKRYYHYSILKDVSEPESAELREGNELHRAFDKRLKGIELPAKFRKYEPLLAAIAAAPGRLFSEQKLAISSAFQPSAWFGDGAWLRTVIDAMKLGDTWARIFDWKTGKPKEDTTQLALMSAAVFAQHSDVRRVRASLVFLNHEGPPVAETFTREGMVAVWGNVLPRVKELEHARNTNTYEPRPSGLCKRYCAVKSCPFHGRGA